jgi:4-hydroxybenzoate polyprenyltransferase
METIENSSGKGVSSRVIVVDLDGTLVNTDTLIENLFLYLRLYPLQILTILIWLFGGKAYFKKCLADKVMPDVKKLPYNRPLLKWLEQQRSEGACLVLATAADQRIADQVADYLGIFAKVLGTNNLNLSSRNKADVLTRYFGTRGFEYIGNSLDDIAVWEKASVIHIANPETGVLAAASKIGEIQMMFNNRKAYIPSAIKALRIHQWAKNLLILVPLLASHRIMEVNLLVSGVLAFFAFSLCASSVYLLNDLIDLPDDREHSSKCNRPIAAGTFPVFHAALLIPVLLLLAFCLAITLLPFQFVIVLTIYYVLTLAYSFWLKRMVMLDVVVLAILYTVRVIAGAMAMSLDVTFWILAFCMFIFLSLAFLKRYTELLEVRQKSKENRILSRGYQSDDLELLASLGGASGYISVMVLALYINEPSDSKLYTSPEWMWLACPLLLYWLNRVWLLAHRGQMHDDPVVFALRDKVSLAVGFLFVLVFALASFS